MKLTHTQLAALIGLGSAIAGLVVQFAIDALKSGTFSLPAAIPSTLVIAILVTVGEYLHNSAIVTPGPSPQPTPVPPAPPSGGA